MAALNATHRPRTLLSGLLFCGCCGGSYARRGQDRYACTNHVLGNGCDNARTIARKALEARVLAGLRDRMMTPEAAAEAMRAYAQETNRLNRERRNRPTPPAASLPKPRKAIAEIVRVIEQGGWHRALSERLTELEARQDNLTARMSDAPQDAPDMHPGIAETYRRRIERLTAALDHPDDAAEAAEAIREIIDRSSSHPARHAATSSSPCKASLATISTGSTAPENQATNPLLTRFNPIVGRRSKPGLDPRIHRSSTLLFEEMDCRVAATPAEALIVHGTVALKGEVGSSANATSPVDPAHPSTSAIRPSRSLASGPIDNFPGRILLH